MIPHFTQSCLLALNIFPLLVSKLSLWIKKKCMRVLFKAFSFLHNNSASVFRFSISCVCSWHVFSSLCCPSLLPFTARRNSAKSPIWAIRPASFWVHTRHPPPPRPAPPPLSSFLFLSLACVFTSQGQKKRLLWYRVLTPSPSPIPRIVEAEKSDAFGRARLLFSAVSRQQRWIVHCSRQGRPLCERRLLRAREGRCLGEQPSLDGTWTISGPNLGQIRTISRTVWPLCARSWPGFRFEPDLSKISSAVEWRLFTESRRRGISPLSQLSAV